MRRRADAGERKAPGIFRIPGIFKNLLARELAEEDGGDGEECA